MGRQPAARDAQHAGVLIEQVVLLLLATLATTWSILDGEPPKLNQSCFLWVQFQAEEAQSLLNIGQVPHCFLLLFEAQDEVLGVYACQRASGVPSRRPSRFSFGAVHLDSAKISIQALAM